MTEIQVQTFKQMEDLLDALRANRAAANSQCSVEQNRIGYGSTVVEFTRDRIIFGIIPTREQMSADEKDLGADAEELASILEQTEANMQNGVVYGQWFSDIETEGEYGHKHKVSLWPCPEWLIERVRALGWDGRELSLTDRKFVAGLFDQWMDRSPEGTR